MGEYVGFDVSKEETSFCVKDASGTTLARGKTVTDPAALFAAMKEHCLCPERIVLETGSMSSWLWHGLSAHGLPVVCVDARQAHAVMKLQHNKTDAGDAELLAELARTGFYRQVAVKSPRALEIRGLLVARAQLVRRRRDLDNAIRGILRSFGVRLPRGTGRFCERVQAALQEHADLALFIGPLLEGRNGLQRASAKLDREVSGRAKKDAVCRLLMTAPGVGPVTALAYVGTIDDPGRFAKSRSVGAYVGLTSRRFQSGEMDYSGRISKQGDALLRTCLFEAANSLLIRSRRANPLKTWARRLHKRLGHKKACVALARKLAVVLHRMWVSGTAFQWPAENSKGAELMTTP
ncbi:MAG: IS110 family transposase [Verrucomicrobiota bacterium]|nr:IS110 family transposase [Verrucomicrobiota bacterium]